MTQIVIGGSLHTWVKHTHLSDDFYIYIMDNGLHTKMYSELIDASKTP